MTSEGIASPPWQTSYPIFFTPTASYNAPSPTPIAAAADDIALPPSSIPKAALVGSGVAGAVVATAVVATIASKMGCSLLAPLVSVLSFIFKKILGIQKCGEVLSICKGRGKDKDTMYDMDDSENSVRSRRNKHHCDSNCRDCVGDDSLRDQNDSSKLSRSPSVSIDVWEELQVTRKHLHDQANHVGYLLRPTKSNISKFAAAEMRKLEGIRDATASMVINKTIINDGQDHNIQTVNIGVGKELQFLDQQLIHQQANDNNLNYNKINPIANSISNQHNSVTINSFEQLQNLTTYKAHDIDVSTMNAKQLQLLEMSPNSGIINSLSPNHAHNPPNLATQTTTPSISHTSSATTSAHLQLQNVTPDTGGRHGTVEIDDTSRESKTTTTTTIPAPNLSSNSNIIFIPPSSSTAAAGYSLHHQSHNPIRLVEINAPPKDLQIISAANPSSSSRSDHDHDAAAASGHSQLRRAHNRRNRAPHRSSNSSRRNSKPNNKRKRLISRVAGVRISCEVSAHFMRFFIFCKTGTNYGDDKPRPIDREEEEESLEFDGEDSFRRRRRRRSDVDGGNSVIHMPSDQHQSLTYHQPQLLPQASNHIHGHQNNQNIIGSSSAVTVPSNSTTMVVPLPESAASVGGGGGVSNFFYGQYYNPSTGTYQLIPLLINPVPANYVINNGGGNYGKVAMMSPMPIPQPHHSGVIISDVATLRGGGGGSGSGGGVNSELTSDTNSLPDKDELPEATATTTTTTTPTKESTKASTTLQIKS